jgi:uncharacterized surface anchored protein
VTEGWLSLMRLDGNGDLGQKNAQTNSTGDYVFENIAPGKYRVQVWTDNVQKSETFVVAAGALETRINLEIPEGSIVGTVVGPDGKAISGASIRVRSMKSYLANPDAVDTETLASAWELQWGQTDGEGKYTVQGVSQGEYAVTVIAAGYSAATKTNIAGVTGGTATVNFTLTSGGTLRVIVKNSAGAVVPDAGVSIRRPDGSTVDVNGAGWMGMGQTDSAGKFETNTLDGTFNVVVTHANHPRKTAGPVVVTPGQVTEFIVTLEAGYSVTVAVKDANGAVVVDATVELIDAAGNPVIPSGWASLFGGIKTDAAGTAAITGVGAGTYSVRVTRVVPGKAPLVESVGSVTVSSHDENAAVVVAPLALEPGDGDY